ncbi:MAG: nuclear transport factor 2 family protein [Planctomycetota bacterium]
MKTPSPWQQGRWVPFVLVWPTGDADGDAARLQALADAGFAAALLDERADSQQLGKSLFAIRQRYRIDQGALHALVGADADTALATLLAQRHEFQTVTVFGAAADADLKAVRRLRTRRVHAVQGADAEALAQHLRRLHDARTPKGAAAKVARTLDSFHDAAAVGDEDRYFAIIPDDAVFLGTDATERWTGKQFRDFAMRYFERPSAWTYVPLERHITFSDDRKLCWFSEALDNAGYGECRGSGVMVLRDGSWVLRQYNLTVPVPNDLMADVARQIRRHTDGK